VGEEVDLAAVELLYEGVERGPDIPNEETYLVRVAELLTVSSMRIVVPEPSAVYEVAKMNSYLALQGCWML
jgi:hypothetical protein